MTASVTWPTTTKKRVFLTGAGGTMGGAALKEFQRPDLKERFELVILDLPTEINKKQLAPYAHVPGLEIIWGDLTDYDDVLRAVTGADIVLHAAAFIPPAADHDPDRAWAVNAGSAGNIVRAIKAQPDPDAVRLVNIGTVAQTGDRLPPIHVGRVGDPIMPSVYDVYGCSKVAAERIVAESGLRYWVSLRQTFIVDPEMAPSPIMFHPPLNTCLEICTVKTAGLVLANVCAETLPERFWRSFYNIGGGPGSRITYQEFLKKTLALSGIESIEAVYERYWFALRNFHCHWFEDSHLLNEYLHHQQEGIESYLDQLQAGTRPMERFVARLTPKAIMKRRLFEPLATSTPDATMHWFKHNQDLRIAAFYKSREAFEEIPDWQNDNTAGPDWYDYVQLDHGYDETSPTAELGLEQLQGAAAFRGGRCLSPRMTRGDLYTKLEWQCAFGHTFEATPNLILKGGHWCPECAPPGWNYDQQAKRNPFLAQVWYTHHDRDEANNYPADCVYDLQKREIP